MRGCQGMYPCQCLSPFWEAHEDPSNVGYWKNRMVLKSMADPQTQNKPIS